MDNNDRSIDIEKFKIEHSDIVSGLVDIFINNFDELYSKLKTSYTKFSNSDKNKKLNWSMMGSGINTIFDLPELIYNAILSKEFLGSVDLNNDIILE